jgi:hypothetical protein
VKYNTKKRGLFAKRFDNFHYLGVSQPSFEGFYCKVAKPDGTTIAVICGFARTKEKSYAFIQIGSHFCATKYFEYPIDSLNINKEGFSFSIEQHQISMQGISIRETDCEINLTFDNFIAWKRTLLKPSIMGALTYVPFVECKHDIVGPHFNASGTVKIEEQIIHFTSDAGYIDRNWGKSFPKKYCWGHLSGFSDDSISIQFAKGSPKWLWLTIPVHIGFLYINGEITTFKSWRGAKIQITNTEDLSVCLRNLKYEVQLLFTRDKKFQLKAPDHGNIEEEIMEYAGNPTRVKIFKRNRRIPNELIYDETVLNSTLEIRE